MKLKKFHVKGIHDDKPFDRKEKQHFTWGYDVTVYGVRYQERGYLTKAAAEDIVTKLKADAKNQRHGIRPIEDEPYLIELFQLSLNAMDNGNDRSRAKRVFKDFLAMLPDKITPSGLRSKDFEDYIQLRKKAGIQNSTIRRELVPVISTLYKARKYSAALENYRPPVIERPKVSKVKRNKVISEQEQNLILNYLSAPRYPGETRAMAAIRRDTADLLQFQLLTASRPGEAAKLTKSDINLHDLTVRIRRDKTQFETDATGFLQITETMREILQRRYSVNRGDYLFTPNGAITPGMYSALKAACEMNGLKYGKNEFDGINFDRARHTVVTRLKQRGISNEIIQQYTGHTTEHMLRHYSHLEPARTDQAAAILEGFTTGKSTENEPDFDTDRDFLLVS